VFAKAREKARTNTCMNNQRQIAVAMLMYVQDNDETFIPVNKTSSWAGYLKPYNEASIYDCPTKTGKGNNDKPEYGFNAGLYAVALGDVKNPTICPLTADYVDGGQNSTNYSFTDFDAQLDTRHNNGLNISCIDGHVAYEAFQGATTSKFAGLVGKGYDPYDGIVAALNQTAQVDLANAAANTATKSATTYTMPAGTYNNGTMPNLALSCDLNQVTLPSYSAVSVGFFLPNNASLITNDGWYLSSVAVRMWQFGTAPDITYTNMGGNVSTSIIDLYAPRKPNVPITWKANTWYTVKCYFLKSGTSYKVVSALLLNGALAAATSETLPSTVIDGWKDQTQVGIFTYSNTTFTGSARNISVKVLP
jgi:prepilin-type processing-associated H-X9-DG protein